ncbi:MAG: hypothetical protein Q4D61_07920, partial [Cardiobacteriaceae bacterium]|nr:hypothetical protein [Cardiobacteriaceae bacterium]
RDAPPTYGMAAFMMIPLYVPNRTCDRFVIPHGLTPILRCCVTMILSNISFYEKYKIIFPRVIKNNLLQSFLLL